tara:strand:- start:151 stop:423 length:273 start_codon:yes stop_codon:yes gene_type:complete
MFMRFIYRIEESLQNELYIEASKLQHHASCIQKASCEVFFYFVCVDFFLISSHRSSILLSKLRLESFVTGSKSTAFTPDPATTSPAERIA